MNPIFVRILFIRCIILLSVIFLGLSGLSFDGEGRRKGRVEILETPDLCRSCGTVCLLTSPCAQMNPIFVRILFICCMTLLSVIFLGLSGFSFDGEGRRNDQAPGYISVQSTRISTTNTALRAVKETEKHDESHVDFTRQCGKSPVTMSAVFHCVYLAWKHPRRRIEVTFLET